MAVRATTDSGAVPSGSIPNGSLAPAVPTTSRRLADDPSYAPFIEDGFNPAEFASKALAGSNASAQVTELVLQSAVRLVRVPQNCL